MANKQKRLPANVAGDFFVDSTCINCDTCRQLAPETFAEQGDYSYVWSQPIDVASRRRSTQALICCPTASIGNLGPNDAADVSNDFPLAVDANVYYCGFNSAKSYGANSYFVLHR